MTPDEIKALQGLSPETKKALLAYAQGGGSAEIAPIIEPANPPNPYGIAAGMVGMPTSPPSTMTTPGNPAQLPQTVPSNPNDQLAMAAVMGKGVPMPTAQPVPPPPNPMSNQLVSLGAPVVTAPKKPVYSADTTLDPNVNQMPANPNAPSKPLYTIPPVMLSAGVGSGKTGGGGGGGKPKSILDYLSPSEKQAFELAAKKAETEGAYNEKMAEAMSNESLYRSTLLKNSAEETEKYNERVQQIQMEKEAYAKSAMELQQKKMDELASTKIDPDKYWADKNMTGKVSAGIGIILGGIGSAMTHTGGNVAIDLIERQIDRDIDSQKANLAKKYNEYGLQKGIYADRLQAFGDQELATLSAKQTYLQELGTQMTARAAELGSDEMQLNAQKASDDINQKVAEISNQMYMTAEQKYNKLKAAQGAAVAAVKKRNEKLWEVGAGVLKSLGEAYAKQGVQTIPSLIKDGPNAGMPVLLDANGKVIATADGVLGGSNGAVSVYSGVNAEGTPMFNGTASPKSKSGGKAYNAEVGRLAEADAYFAELAKIHEEFGTEVFPTDASDRAKTLAQKLNALGFTGVPKDPTGLGDKWTDIKAEWGDLRKKLSIAEQVNLSNGPKPFAFGKPADDTETDEE